MQCTIKLIHINSITLQIVNTMLQIENLEFSYHKKGNPIFNGINLTIQPGSVYGLLGKNRIGKSTLLYMMCGLMFPHKGSIRFDGIEVKRRLPETLEKFSLCPKNSISLPYRSTIMSVGTVCFIPTSTSINSINIFPILS